MSDHHLTQTSFSTLPLMPVLLQGIREAGFEFCTPIQAAALPQALAGRDVAGQAQTGTGKTAAFLLATFNRLLQQPAATERRSNQPRAVILAPTRELAIQIHNDAEMLGKHTGFKLGLVYGGVGYESQRKMLEQGVDILIATPGRMIDYLKQQIFDLKAVQVMVLDEADRMFDLGFIKDIRFLLRRMPPPSERLGMLFSATLSYRVNELAYEHMNNPLLIKIESGTVTVDKVKEILYHTAGEEKIPLLIGLLRRQEMTRSLVFTNTKGAAERVNAWLSANGLHAAVLSGDVPQTKRQHLLQGFQRGKFPILVATDVAARGLHIPEVSHVFNFDLPQDPEDYLHRIGRTARAGASGDAVSFACEQYAFSLLDIEKFIGHKIPVERMSDELLAPLQAPTASLRGKNTSRRNQRGRTRTKTEPKRRAPDNRPRAGKARSDQPAAKRAHPWLAAERGHTHLKRSAPLKPHRRRKGPEKPVIG
ncbi:MAG TPA: ATP-dependent RNA helicase RhlB [Acidiferrobacterales bacterium]|nr:ATP-dependent RNA helicase RhlB [Acidiferrobacterales bacterium]